MNTTLSTIACLSLLSASFYSQADALRCGLGVRHHGFGGLPEFRLKHAIFPTYDCAYRSQTPRYYGRWFPTRPNLHFSQSLPNNSDEELSFYQSWQVQLPLIRLKKSTIYLNWKHQDGRQIASTQEIIQYLPETQRPSLLAEGQSTQLSQQHDEYAFSVHFPASRQQAITRISLQHTQLKHPLQSNVENQAKRSLYPANITLNEIIVGRHKTHKGMNFNWHVGIGSGDVSLAPSAQAPSKDKENSVISFRGQISLSYHLRLNRKTRAYVEGSRALLSWRQISGNNTRLQLPNTHYWNDTLSVGIHKDF